MNDRKIDRTNFDVLIIGPSRGFEVVLAQHLSKAGLKCVVLKREFDKDRMLSTFPGLGEEKGIAKIIWVKNRFEFLKYARKSRIIVSFSGVIINYLYFLWPFRSFLRLPPVIQWFDGSDGSERIIEKSWRGMLFRQYLHYTSLNIGHPYPHSLNNFVSLKIPNLVFIRYPYYLPTSNEAPKRRINDRLRFFHPSNLDWRETNSGDRNSTKGNDRFIKAFGRAVKEGLQAECIILDRGPDKEIAKKLIADLNLTNYFTWKQHLSRDELAKEYAKADVVVDQFDVGAYGGIAIEAMSLGKPVMVYVNLPANKLVYDDPPPVLNARSEEEIYSELMRCADRAYLETLGEEAKVWAHKYQGPQSYLPLFLFYYSLLTGHRIENYGIE